MRSRRLTTAHTGTVRFPIGPEIDDIDPGDAVPPGMAPVRQVCTIRRQRPRSKTPRSISGTNNVAWEDWANLCGSQIRVMSKGSPKPSTESLANAVLDEALVR